MPMRTCLSLLTLCAAITCQAAEGPQLHLTFDDVAALKGAKLADKDGIAGKYLLLDGAPSCPPFELKPAARDKFTLAAWIKVHEFVDEGPSGFSARSPMTVAVLSVSGDRDNRACLRVRERRLELAVLGPSRWHHVRSGRPLPGGEWVHVAGTYGRGVLALYVNAAPAAMSAGGVRGDRLGSVRVGAWGRRMFVGGIDEVMVFGRNLRPAEIAAIVKRHRDVPRPSPKPWSPQAVPMPYRDRALRVGPDVAHPIAAGINTQVTIVPWSKAGARDLLLCVARPWRAVLYREVSVDPKSPHGFPLYDRGEPCAMKGFNLRALSRPDGTFDLAAKSGHHLRHFRNAGAPGKPEFAAPEEVEVDGWPCFVAAAEAGARAGYFAIGDVSGDGHPDLLVASAGGGRSSYWPDGISVWSRRVLPNTGPGKGFDVMGNWLGDKRTSSLFWAAGQPRKDGRLAFGAFRKVYYRTPGFQVQWRSWVHSHLPGVLRVAGQTYVIMSSDVNRILALPVRVEGDDLICGQAQPLLRGGTLPHMYLAQSLCAVDLDRDGQDELVLSGNPGRVAVLKGDRVGEFEEVSPLRVRGGYLEVETLANPCRVDWDGDGREDVVCGDSSGLLSLWPGTDDPMVYGEPIFLSARGKRIRHRAGPTGSIQGPNEAGWGYLQPTVGDWDGDGRLDVVTNDVCAEMMLYRRGESDTDLRPAEPFTLAGKPLPVAWRSRPAILPGSFGCAGDRRPCLLYMDWDGDLAIAAPARAGGTEMERTTKLHYADGAAIRLCGPCGHWGRTKFAVADWDGDGLWDVVFGTNMALHPYFVPKSEDQTNPRSAAPFWMRNVGTARAPVLQRPKLIRQANGEPYRFGVHNASCWPTDLNRDGRLDLIIGIEEGKVYGYLRDELRW